MYTNLAKFVDKSKPLHTMGDAFDRFIVEKLPFLAKRTQSDCLGYIEKLRLYFNDAPPADVTAGDVFDYRNKRAEKSVTQANREKSCLSSVFTAAIEWKLRKDNPCREVPKLTSQSGTVTCRMKSSLRFITSLRWSWSPSLAR